LIAAGFVVAACVPSTDESDPRGAVALDLTPSPASKGEPFVTSDGWTVHVDLLAVQIFFVVVPHDGEQGGLGGMYVFRASDSQRFVVVAIPATAASTNLTLVSRFIEDAANGLKYNGLADPPESHGVDRALDDRFEGRSEASEPLADGGVLDAAVIDGRRGPLNAPSGPPDDDRGPSVILDARAEKDGRVVHLGVTFDQAWDGLNGTTDVVADSLVSVSFPVRAEALFQRSDGALVFDDIAAADLDHDGEISPDEFRHEPAVSCSRCSDAEKGDAAAVARASVLANALGDRATRIFSP
jgi:hypothetical protein